MIDSLWIALFFLAKSHISDFTHPLNPPPQGRGRDKVNHHPTRDGLKILSLRESRSDSWQSKFKNCVLF